MGKKILFVLILVCSLNIIFSQNKITSLKKEELKKYSDNLIKLLFDDKIDDVFISLSQNWPIGENELSAIKNQTLKQWDIIKQRFGNKLDYVFIEEKEVAGTFIRHIYIIKYEFHITRWVIIYYKPKDKWIVNGFKWDDQAESLF